MLRRTGRAPRAEALSARGQGRELIGVVTVSQISERLRVGRTARRELGELLEITLVARRRNGHQHAGRPLADIGDVVRHARWDEHIGSRRCANRPVADMPLAFALDEVERLLLHPVNMAPGGEPRRDCPVEHARVPGIFAGDEEDHRITTQHDPLLLIGHANDGVGAHVIPPSLKRFAPASARAPSAGCAWKS
jgi:hypothetical protein